MPEKKTVQEVIYKKKEKLLNVTDIEYLGISTVLFICKNKTQKIMIR